MKHNQGGIQYEKAQADMEEEVESDETNYEWNVKSRENNCMAYAEYLNTLILSMPHEKQKMCLRRVLKVIMAFADDQ